jgi:Ala-tRNA(Pro) deacylase
LINDRERHVRVFLDSDLRSAPRISFHPNINTATVTLTFADFERFLAACGSPVAYVTVEHAGSPGE